MKHPEFLPKEEIKALDALETYIEPETATNIYIEIVRRYRRDLRIIPGDTLGENVKYAKDYVKAGLSGFIMPMRKELGVIPKLWLKRDRKGNFLSHDKQVRALNNYLVAAAKHQMLLNLE